MAKGKLEAPDINLLPEDDLLGRPGGKFLIWALSWGKKIVIVTELLVVIAFLSRFWLDTTIANQSDIIDQKKTIILASGDFEKQFTQVKDRLGKVAAEEAIPREPLIKLKVEAFIPAGVVVERLGISGRSISLSGNGNDQALAKMVADFKDSNVFSNVSITKVSKVEGPNINFSLTAIYEGGNGT